MSDHLIIQMGYTKGGKNYETIQNNQKRFAE